MRCPFVEATLESTKSTAIIDGLTKLFREIREKDRLEDLSVQYKKFAEWLRIE